MSHDEDPSQQVAAYGDTAQPAIAARMAPHLRLTQIGAASALLSVIAAAAAVIMFPSFAGAGPGLAWAVGALVSAGLMLIICVIQVVVWRRAMASWLGKRVPDLRVETQLSWIAHLMSYAVALAALFTTMAGSAALARPIRPRPPRLFCWESPCSLSSLLRYSPECSFCVPVALPEPSQRTFDDSKRSPAPATIEVPPGTSQWRALTPRRA